MEEQSPFWGRRGMLTAEDITPADQAGEAATSASHPPAREPADPAKPPGPRSPAGNEAGAEAARSATHSVVTRLLAILEDPGQPGATAVGAANLLIKVAGGTRPATLRLPTGEDRLVQLTDAELEALEG